VKGRLRGHRQGLGSMSLCSWLDWRFEGFENSKKEDHSPLPRLLLVIETSGEFGFRIVGEHLLHRIAFPDCYHDLSYDLLNDC
jgi:hypothetical protein